MKLSQAFKLFWLPALLLVTQPAWADSIQVTFTGNIYFTFDQQFGGPSFHGIQNGDSFSSVLTYDLSQPNLGTVPGQGVYGNYSYIVTIQTAGGPVSLGGQSTDPVHVQNDFDDEFGPADVVYTAGPVGFVFRDYTHTALSTDALAGVNWQSLLTLSNIPQPLVRAPNAAVVANGSVHDMFLRAPNAAVVVIGRINTVDVQTIPSPVPESGSVLLLSLGLFVLLAIRRHRRRSSSNVVG